MRKNLKMAAVGGIAALSLASATAIAQQTTSPNAETPQMNQQTMRDGGGMMGMMQDSEMRRQMTEMMGNCSRMMERMNGGMAEGAPRT